MDAELLGVLISKMGKATFLAQCFTRGEYE